MFCKNNLRTDRAKEYIFSASRDANFENLPARHQPWWCLYGFDVCNNPLKTLDTSLVLSMVSQNISSSVGGKHYTGNISSHNEHTPGLTELTSLRVFP